MARPPVALALAAILWAGCTAVSSSSYATAPRRAPSTAPVSIASTRDPADALELGVVESSGRLGAVTLEQLVAAFRSRVAQMGGDAGRIDTFGTRYEIVSESYEYDCSTTETEHETRTVSRIGPGGTITFDTESVPVTRRVPKTCTGTRSVEVGTLSLVGRAFGARGAKP